MSEVATKKEGRPKGGPFSMVEPPDFLKSKMVKGRGVDLRTVEERAEAMVKALKGEYLERVKKELGMMEQSIEAARQGSEKSRAKSLSTVSHLSHEVKGQAGTFGFDLITVIGTSLCDYIAEIETPVPEDVEVIEIHVDAMRLVVSDNIQGDGSETGRHLLGGIRAVVAKMQSR